MVIDVNDEKAVIDEFFYSGIVHLNVTDVTPQILKKVSAYFGKILIVGKHHIPGDRRVQIISENGLFGNGDVPWHNDFSYSIGDYHGTLLGYKSCDTETYTEFVDVNLAWDKLPEDQKEYLSDVEGVFGVPGKYKSLVYDTQYKLVAKDVMKRPLAMRHPVTGKTSLYFSPETLMETSKEIDKPALIEHCEKYAFKHHWKEGDMILWDNRRMLHRRAAFEGHRELLRTNFQYEFLHANRYGFDL